MTATASARASARIASVITVSHQSAWCMPTSRRFLCPVIILHNFHVRLVYGSAEQAAGGTGSQAELQYVRGYNEVPVWHDCRQPGDRPWLTKMTKTQGKPFSLSTVALPVSN